MKKRPTLSSGLISSKTFKNYNLHDTKEPQLYRDLFPYDEICSIDFDNVISSASPPRECFITDTTFRDGQQARPPYSVKQIVDLFTLLHRLGGPKGLIRMTEFFLYSQKDRAAVDKCRELGFDFPIITSWIRAVKSDFQLVKDMKIKETGILTSVSDYHIFLKLGITRKEALKRYLEIVDAALEEGIHPRCHFEDITRADFHGFVIPFAQELMKRQKESGIPIKIRACDTMGYGVPYPGAALPRSVDKVIYSLRHEAGVPSEQLEWHGHNDFHKAHVNSVAAWLAGCAGINTSLLGIGERTGNSPLEAAVIEYISLFGNNEMHIDTTVISEIGEYFTKEIGHQIPANFPFLGTDFNTTRAGIHADGVIKNKEIYSIFNTEKILNRSLDVSITDKTGVAGIAHWINANIIKEKNIGEINKRHPGVKKIYQWVLDQYETGRTTSISNDELFNQVKVHLPALIESDFDKLTEHAKDMAFHIVEEISAKDEMQKMDNQLAEQVLIEYVNKFHFISFAYVVNKEGKKITKNIAQQEDIGKYDQYIDIETDFSDRDWFCQPMKDGAHHATNFYTSKITGEFCMTVSAPIVNNDDDIIGVVGVDMRFTELAKINQIKTTAEDNNE